MEEISTSFCFICLLHLANEQGLKIRANSGEVISDDEDEGEEGDESHEDRKNIGDIWGLQVSSVFANFSRSLADTRLASDI